MWQSRHSCPRPVNASYIKKNPASTIPEDRMLLPVGWLNVHQHKNITNMVTARVSAGESRRLSLLQMRSCHGISTACPIPPMLRQIQLVCDTEENTAPPASIPLADHVDEFDDGHICLDHSRFLREFVFARDIQLLLR